MDLRDRSTRNRLLFEFGESAIQGFAERILDFGFRKFEGKRRHAVLKFCQLVGDIQRQQVAPRREHLAELDEDRSQCFQRLAQAHAAAGVRAGRKRR